MTRSWRRSMEEGARAFEGACADPERAQQATLRRLLGYLAGSSFADEHGLDENTTYEEFKTAVPLREASEVVPYMDRVLAGKRT